MAKSPRPRKRARHLVGQLDPEAMRDIFDLSHDNNCANCTANLVAWMTRYGEACARARLRTAAAALRLETGHVSAERTKALDDAADMLLDMARPKRRKGLGP
jgi:hypothetical protein